MTTIIIGIGFALFGVYGFITKKSPGMKSYYATIEKRFILPNKMQFVYLDSAFYLVAGLLFVLGGVIFNEDSIEFTWYLAAVVIIELVIYFVIKNQLMKQRKLRK